jgi:hypothetical protein
MITPDHPADIPARTVFLPSGMRFKGQAETKAAAALERGETNESV